MFRLFSPDQLYSGSEDLTPTRNRNTLCLFSPCERSVAYATQHVSLVATMSLEVGTSRSFTQK